MKGIVPHLWFDVEALEAARFYVGLFENSGVTNTFVIGNTPSGEAMLVDFTLAGQPFEAISAGPEFRFNPSVSLMVACETAQEVDALWKALSEGGEALMDLGEYPFSKRYGWIQDRFGLSWQLMLTAGGTAQKITPCLLFARPVCGKAEEAARFYAGLFRDSGVDFVSRYAEGEAMVKDAKANYVDFHLGGMRFAAMDHGYGDGEPFNEAVSFIVNCESQAEVDDFWGKLSAVPEAEACGWLKDRYGVSWQIVPTAMTEMMATGTQEQLGRVTQAFLQMKKFDIASLKRAFDGA